MKIMMIMMIMMIITIMTMVIIVAPSNYQSTQIVRKAGTTKPLNWKNRLRAGAIEKLKSCTPWTNLDRNRNCVSFLIRSHSEGIRPSFYICTSTIHFTVVGYSPSIPLSRHQGPTIPYYPPSLGPIPLLRVPSPSYSLLLTASLYDPVRGGRPRPG